MDVSDREEALLKSQEEPGGEELIQQVVSLTGLPGAMVHKELNQILELSGQDSQALTLEQLRAAMLAYLESLQAELADH
jgi:hypothetical protein